MHTISYVLYDAFLKRTNSEHVRHGCALLGTSYEAPSNPALLLPKDLLVLLSFVCAVCPRHQDLAIMKILSLSTDPELSQLRRAVLQTAGHQVEAITSEKEALQAAGGTEHYDVVLICHRFPSASARQFVRLLRQGQPDTRIVYIVHVYGEWPEVEADRYIVGADGPAALVRVLEEVQV